MPVNPPVIPVKTGIHTFLMLDCHWTSPKCMGKSGVVAKTKDPVLASAWQAPGSSRKNRGWYNFRNHRRRDVVLDPCVSPECRAPSTPVGMNTKSARIRRTNFGSRILLTYDQTLVCVGRAQAAVSFGRASFRRFPCLREAPEGLQIADVFA